MAKKKAAKKAATKKAAKKSTRKPAKGKKRQIEQYGHAGQDRPNNPPVGLVTSSTDPAMPEKKTYAYDPHIDPALQFDSQGSQVERILDDGLDATAVPDDAGEDELRAALAAARDSLSELKHRREPYLNWAGKAERTSFEVPTVTDRVRGQGENSRSQVERPRIRSTVAVAWTG